MSRHVSLNIASATSLGYNVQYSIMWCTIKDIVVFNRNGVPSCQVAYMMVTEREMHSDMKTKEK
jgi:hypothetical protein